MAPGLRYEDLARFGNSALEDMLKNAGSPALDSVAGWQWRGYNTPWYCALIGIRKFIKGFFLNAQGELEGYNIPVRQNGLEGPWLHKPSPEEPKRFGFFNVTSTNPEKPRDLHPNALLLDYGSNRRNAPWQIERLLRDYLVQPDPGNPDLLLGKAYLALGQYVPVSFFILERLEPSDWRP